MDKPAGFSNYFNQIKKRSSSRCSKSAGESGDCIRMKPNIKNIIFTFFLLMAGVASAAAQTTSFTYQGRLTDGSAAASGSYEMEFKLYDALAGGAQVGSTVSNSAVTVTSGIFVVSLDFGTSPFTAGASRWLEISVRKAADAPGFTVLSPRQELTTSPYSIRTISASQADGLSSACVTCVTDSQIQDVAATKITGSVPVSGGGTGATDASTARTNLGLGSLSTVTPTGTGSTTTFLRGDNTWSTPSVTLGAGNNNYLTKWTTAGTVIGNSMVQDNGTGLSIGNQAPNALYQAYVYRQQQTAAGDGQATLMGYRDRNSQNDGTAYSQIGSNTGVTGHSFWGDQYSFGVGGWNYNDFSRTGGVIGAEINGGYWGSLGYKASNTVTYGVYASNAPGTGSGLTGENQGIGGGFYGGLIGSWSRGDVMGQVNAGNLFASYNMGNVYNSGFTADVVSLNGKTAAGSVRSAAYAVTSPKLKVYDNGTVTFEGGSTVVQFTPEYAGMLSEVPGVTLTAVGSPAQLFIKTIDGNGFVVVNPNPVKGASVTFNWIAVGARVDWGGTNALPSQLLDNNFDQTLKDVLFNENNLKDTAKPLWWDGSKLRTDPAPALVNPLRPAAKTQK